MSYPSFTLPGISFIHLLTLTNTHRCLFKGEGTIYTPYPSFTSPDLSLDNPFPYAFFSLPGLSPPSFLSLFQV